MIRRLRLLLLPKCVGSCSGSGSASLVRSIRKICFRMKTDCDAGETAKLLLSSKWQVTFLCVGAILTLTRHWLGGGGAYNAPLAIFLNNLKTRTDIDAKLTVPYTASTWHLHTKFQPNLFDFFRKWRFSDVMPLDFGPKNGQLSTASRM